MRVILQVGQPLNQPTEMMMSVTVTKTAAPADQPVPTTLKKIVGQRKSRKKAAETTTPEPQPQTMGLVERTLVVEEPVVITRVVDPVTAEESKVEETVTLTLGGAHLYMVGKLDADAR